MNFIEDYTLEELLDVKLDLESKLPPFEVIPPTNAEEERLLDDNGIITIIQLLGGDYAGMTLVINDVDFRDGSISTEYCLIGGKESIPLTETTDELVENLIYYFICLDQIQTVR